ncbi:PPE domain-containing protein [Salinifilum ghardaiensis]
MSDHRWQGYSHAELFAQINSGPGPDGSTDPARRWGELTRALDEIDEGIATAVRSAAADWEGAAADSARDGLRPLAEWAARARHAAATMRERAEQQAEFISRARRDMPPPVHVTAEEPGPATTLLTHLFGGQTDYEHQEARKAAAEQRAHDVMRSYESSTAANTTALAAFDRPPRPVVDAGTAPAPAPGGSAERAVTLSWTAAPGAGGATARPGEQPLPGRAQPGAAAPSRGGTISGATAPSRTGTTSRTGTAVPRGGAGTSRDGADDGDEATGGTVTEDLGRGGGFFDAPHTTAVPVIGGDPDR